MTNTETKILAALKVKFPTMFSVEIKEDEGYGDVLRVYYVATHDDPRHGIAEGDTATDAFYLEGNTVVDCCDSIIVRF